MNTLFSFVFNNPLLFIHIIGAGITGIFSLFALESIISKRQNYSFFAKNIGLLAAFQLITGSVLMLLAKETQSLLAFCSRVGLYVIAVLLVEGLLFLAMKKTSQNLFPARFVGLSLLSALPFMVMAVVNVVP